MTPKSLIYKILYRYISTVDKKKEILFMNYGYHNDDDNLQLSENDEINRYSIQLYHRMAKMAEITGKNIIEVGCGRGGGLSYVTRVFQPGSALGIDLDARAVKFANKHYQLEGLKFRQGNAEKLDIPDNSIDIVLNVESSHRYHNMEKFLDEVYRVLRPGGYFLLTDFRKKNSFDALKALIATKNFIKSENQIINNEVIRALELDTPRRIELVDKYAPMFLKKHIHDFAGNIGSKTYNNIKSGEYIYFIKRLRKPE